jgi:DNA-binding response OmpR family regulator
MARILVVDDSPTIRKVVTAILARHGYETVVAADGQLALEALEEEERGVDLVLLDFVMPKMNGFQFCRAIRGSSRFAMLPVVLMSAKSDKIRDQFVEQTGAIDAISKPFDAQALVVAIENALRRMNQGRASQGRLPELEDLDEPVSSRRALDDAEVQARAATHLGATLGAVLAPALATLPHGAQLDRAQIAHALAQGLKMDAIQALIAALRSVDLGAGPMALAGDIGTIPIGAVLQMLQVESQTGGIVVSNGTSEVTITMRAGLIDLVQSRGAGDEFRLGRFFVEEGLVTPSEIDALTKDHPPVRRTRSGEIRAAQSEGRIPVAESVSPDTPPEGQRASGVESQRRLLLGDVLVQAGRVTRDQLKSALARQSSELIYEVLRWPKGQFEFHVQPSPPLAQRAQLGLPVASVVMEGFRRVDEWRLVEAGLGSFESVLVRDPVAIDALSRPSAEGEPDAESALSRQEHLVLDLIDGERTVREIIAASHMSSFDACRILMQFLEARLVRRRPG